MNLRLFLKSQAPSSTPQVTSRANGRYVWILTDRRVYRSPDVGSFESVMREMLVPSKFKDEKLQIYLFGASDTVAILEQIVADWRAISDAPVELKLDTMTEAEYLK
jgi:hypothetical protein